MLFSRSLAVAASSFLLSNLAAAQTSTKCDPLSQTCAPDPALGGTANINFQSGADNSAFTSSGNSISYGSNGAQFTIAKSGDSPLLTSKWYIMFGKVDIVMQAAPGAGIVTSAVLQSDDLDEIDWEILGGQLGTVQTNYFGKGVTGSYDRGANYATDASTFQTYTVDWTADQIVWQINGNTLRTLEPANANGQYPQTPMQLKIGSWAGGDPALNAPGVVSWSGGPTNYANGPFNMYVKSINVQDYSTGTQYVYEGSSGTWQSIKAIGGSVYSGGSNTVQASVPVTSSSSGQPIPFEGTHASTAAESTVTSIAGLPSGWTITGTGKVVPPSTAPSTSLAASSTSSPQSSSAASSAGSAGTTAIATLSTATTNGSAMTTGPTTYSGMAPAQTAGAKLLAAAGAFGALALFL